MGLKMRSFYVISLLPNWNKNDTVISTLYIHMSKLYGVVMANTFCPYQDITPMSVYPY